MAVSGEAVQLHAGHIKPLLFTTSHARIRIKYYKSYACIRTCNEIKGSYVEIIIPKIPSYMRKKNEYHLFVAIHIVTHAAHS